MVPRTIYAIRKALEAAIEPGKYVAHVEALSRKLLADFNIRWGTGVEGTVFTDHEGVTIGRRAKGLTLLHQLAARVDPRFGIGKMKPCANPPVQLLPLGLDGAADLEALDEVLVDRMVEVALAGRGAEDEEGEQQGGKRMRVDA
jgi:hypothetical protein